MYVIVLTLKLDISEEVCMSWYGIGTLSLSHIPYPGCIIFTPCCHMVTERQLYELRQEKTCLMGI